MLKEIKSQPVNLEGCKAQEEEILKAFENAGDDVKVVLGYKKVVLDKIREADLFVDFALYDSKVNKNVELVFPKGEMLAKFLFNIAQAEKMVSKMTAFQLKRISQAFHQARFEIYNNFSPAMETVEKISFSGDVAHMFWYLAMARYFLGLGSVDSKFYKDIQNLVENFVEFGY